MSYFGMTHGFAVNFQVMGAFAILIFLALTVFWIMWNSAMSRLVLAAFIDFAREPTVRNFAKGLWALLMPCTLVGLLLPLLAGGVLLFIVATLLPYGVNCYRMWRKGAFRPEPTACFAQPPDAVGASSAAAEVRAEEVVVQAEEVQEHTNHANNVESNEAPAVVVNTAVADRPKSESAKQWDALVNFFVKRKTRDSEA
mmetsp:Transcript_16612/g.31406  ORF Transcript_16612/g.31406 Transcript_16612/m.31406 type:complete len:198 (-) Transcript_16612:58-651(-)